MMVMVRPKPKVSTRKMKKNERRRVLALCSVTASTLKLLNH